MAWGLWRRAKAGRFEKESESWTSNPHGGSFRIFGSFGQWRRQPQVAGTPREDLLSLWPLPSWQSVLRQPESPERMEVSERREAEKDASFYMHTLVSSLWPGTMSACNGGWLREPERGPSCHAPQLWQTACQESNQVRGLLELSVRHCEAREDFRAPTTCHSGCLGCNPELFNKRKAWKMRTHSQGNKPYIDANSKMTKCWIIYQVGTWTRLLELHSKEKGKHA